MSSSENYKIKSDIKESYWFAHGGIENHSFGNVQSDCKSRTGDAKDQLLQKKEEKLRIFRELQEEERIKKLKELEQQFMTSKKHRELQEEERRQRIEEARVREIERRHQVEERKRQIWEAEQERKEAILRRNMEREARIEARRNAHRNSQSFAFGSSTPRTFDLDLAAIGVGRNTNQGSVLMSSVSGRRSEERELVPVRATSACSLDRKLGDDCMSRSMVSLSSATFRGRKRTDIMPTFPRERSVTPHIAPRGNQSMRAVSMTRLDQLAQPRRTYHDPMKYNVAAPMSTSGPRTVSPSMSKSMCNLVHASAAGRKTRPPISSSRCTSSMSQSMLHLADKSPPKDNGYVAPHPGQPRSGMRPAQSMMHLAAPPRLTRTARLRAQAANRCMSAWDLNKTNLTKQSLSPGSSHSPTRPQSSMSGNSEISATSSSISAVNMRIRPAPRRPRPSSVAGTLVDSSKNEPARQLRLSANSAATSVQKTGTAKVDPKPALKKPRPPPKSSEVIARAKSLSVPSKDNLRRVSKSLDSSSSFESKTPAIQKEKPVANKKLSGQSEEKTNLLEPQMRPASPSTTTPPRELEASVSSEVSQQSLAVEEDSVNHLDLHSKSKLDNSSFTKCTTDNSEENVLTNSIIEKQTQSIPTNIPPNVEKEQVPLVAPVKNCEPENNCDAVESSNKELISSKPRITSEEEAKAALAEKRRLAREQADREAELERLRLEEVRRNEENQRRLEEAELKRMEEEQIRLAELHRQLEEEKLRKAIEEQQKLEKEEQDKRLEEARQKAEREEQEKKAREEAEKQRLELEEKLKKEEEERAERKKRVEQIMARTRGKVAQSPSSNFSSENNSKCIKNDDAPVIVENNNLNDSSLQKDVLDSSKEESVAKRESDSYLSASIKMSSFKDGLMTEPMPDLLSSDITGNHNADTNGVYAHSEEELSNIHSNSFSVLSNRSMSANIEMTLQSNGYNSHEEMSCTTSPEENTTADSLIDFSSLQNNSKASPVSTDFTPLTGEAPSVDNNANSKDFLIDVDSINCNFNSPLIGGFDDNLQKKQDTTVTDLLS